MSDEGMMLEYDETNRFVLAVADKMWAVGVDEISRIDKRQQFLLWSRIISTLFHRHFRFSIYSAEKIATEADGSTEPSTTEDK